MGCCPAAAAAAASFADPADSEDICRSVANAARLCAAVLTAAVLLLLAALIPALSAIHFVWSL